MKKLVLGVCVLLCMTTFARPKEWLDPEVNAINRLAARSAFFAILAEMLLNPDVRRMLPISCR